MEKKSVYQIVTDRIVERLETVSETGWNKPWFDLATAPKNAISGREYSGINVFLLSGLGTGNFATYKQWAEKECQVKKGEKAHIVTFWNFTEKTLESGEKKKIGFLRYFSVFEAGQVEGDFAREIENSGKKLADHEKIEAAEKIAGGYLTREKLAVKQGDQASYSPAFDRVTMPALGQFKDAESYYATLLHELTHSTGHSTRLDRDLKNGFGSAGYAFEELVAELGAAMVLGKAGLVNVPRDDHAVYIKSWLRALKNDSTLIVKAASKAQKAANLIFGEVESEVEA